MAFIFGCYHFLFIFLLRHWLIIVLLFQCMEIYGSYYDVFIKKYQKLIQERKWKQPLLGSFSLLVKAELVASTFEFHFMCLFQILAYCYLLAVALSYSLQIVEEPIPVSPHDVPVDALVSPCGFIPISPVALERCD